MANPPSSHYPDIGELGEDLVAQWLHSQGWKILHRRFYSPWGEIDIIAQFPEQHLLVNSLPQVAFVEVKTRSQGNWDAGGKGAITRQKQVKIGRTARMFLAQYPEKADYLCRFDVAIVYCKQRLKQHPALKCTPEPLATLSADEYQFYLQEYLPAAFDSCIDE
ncbi:YraN family protein [Nodularia chucula]|uniref:YraN family protein n=1 Tax=Nodularia chucula TaxID=3093667 RepID=UPI0039C5DD4A